MLSPYGLQGAGGGVGLVAILTIQVWAIMHVDQDNTSPYNQALDCLSKDVGFDGAE